jgi:hypothetical protein
MKYKMNQKGQALIELVIFLPLMFMFYSMISGFANAINGSINQQKIARSYFYYRIQNNSNMPKPSWDPGDPIYNWGQFGMFFIGWKDYFVDRKPVAPCYRLTIPLQAGSSDTCEERYNTPTTQFIRVQTAYGACGATYQRIDREFYHVPDFTGGTYSTLIDRSGCFISR